MEIDKKEIKNVADLFKNVIKSNKLDILNNGIGTPEVDQPLNPTIIENGIPTPRSDIINNPTIIENGIPTPEFIDVTGIPTPNKRIRHGDPPKYHGNKKKLTEERAQLVRDAYAIGKSMRQLADVCEVSQSTIRGILKGKLYKK